MACLLKVLGDMLQNPQPLSHIHICPIPKVKLSPTNLIYPALMSTTQPSSVDVVGPASAQVCRTVANFPQVDDLRFINP